MTVIDRLQRAMHMESAAIAPRTSEAIEAMRAGIAEIERLKAGMDEYACTGTEHPCGCYSEFLSERAEIGRLQAALEDAADFIDPDTDPWRHVTQREMAARLRAALNQQTTRYVCETCRDNPYLCSTIPTSHCAKAETLKDE
jgi:hypothetical protein